MRIILRILTSRDRATSRPWVTGLVVLAFVARIAARLWSGESEFLRGSYGFYLSLARGLLDGHGFCGPDGDACAFRLPVYTAWVAPFEATGTLYPGLVMAQAALGASMVWMAWRAAAARFGVTAGLAAATLTAVSPYAVVHDTALQDSVMANVLVAGTLAAIAGIGPRERASVRVLLAGSVAALAVLTTARVAFVLPAVGVWALVSVHDWPTRLQRSFLVMVPVMVLVGGWTLRTNRLIGSPVLTTESDTSLWFANNPATFSSFPRRSIDRSAVQSYAILTDAKRAALEAVADDRVAYARLTRSWAFEYIRSQPVATLRGAARKVWVVVAAELSPARGWLLQSGYGVFFGTVHLLAAWALWRDRRQWRQDAPAWALLTGFLAITAVYWAHTSHKSAIDVPLFVYAGGTIARLARRASDETGGAGAPCPVTGEEVPGWQAAPGPDADDVACDMKTM